ncbi:MAG: hypothetical protein ACKVVP_04260 [Chloroflexota bacterium]
MKDVIVWNEPNHVDAPLDAEHFAALLYHTRKALNELNPRPNMYWGGIFFSIVPGQPNTVATEDMDYVTSVYDAIVAAQAAGDVEPGWPWDGINVHVHRERSPEYVDSLFTLLKEKLRMERSDPAIGIIGEWGITLEDYAAGIRVQAILDRLRTIDPDKPRADLMIYFAHHYVDERSGPGQWGTTFWTESPGSPGSYNLADSTVLYQNLRDALRAIRL